MKPRNPILLPAGLGLLAIATTSFSDNSNPPLEKPALGIEHDAAEKSVHLSFEATGSEQYFLIEQIDSLSDLDDKGWRVGYGIKGTGQSMTATMDAGISRQFYRLSKTGADDARLQVDFDNDSVILLDELDRGLPGFELEPADDDNDLIPNDFEVVNGLDKTDASDAAEDRDGDGINNVSEYLLGHNINITEGDRSTLKIKAVGNLSVSEKIYTHAYNLMHTFSHQSRMSRTTGYFSKQSGSVEMINKTGWVRGHFENSFFKTIWHWGEPRTEYHNQSNGYYQILDCTGPPFSFRVGHRELVTTSTTSYTTRGNIPIYTRVTTTYGDEIYHEIAHWDGEQLTIDGEPVALPSGERSCIFEFGMVSLPCLIKVYLEKVDRDDPSKTWADSAAYRWGEPIYAGESNGDMVSWEIARSDLILQGLTFTWTAEGPDGETKTGPSGTGESKWIIADEDPTDEASKWIDWKPGKWTIKCQLDDGLVQFEQEIGVRTEEYFAFGRVTADVAPPAADVSADVLDVWTCPVLFPSIAAAAGGVNNPASSYFVPFEWEDRMFVNHQLLNTTSNLPPPINENKEPEEAFGLDKLRHYRFFVYGHFKFLTKGNKFAKLPEAIGKVALLGGTPVPCSADRSRGPLGEAHSDHGVHRFIGGNKSEFEFIGKVRAGTGAVNGNANVNGRELPWAFLRLRFSPDDGLIDTKFASHSTDPNGPDDLDFSGVPNIAIMRRYYDLNAKRYRVELVENLEESQAKREDFFLSGPPISGKPYLLER